MTTPAARQVQEEAAIDTNDDYFVDALLVSN
jgi:hypothetical protein